MTLNSVCILVHSLCFTTKVKTFINTPLNHPLFSDLENDQFFPGSWLAWIRLLLKCDNACKHPAGPHLCLMVQICYNLLKTVNIFLMSSSTVLSFQCPSNPLSTVSLTSIQIHFVALRTIVKYFQMTYNWIIGVIIHSECNGIDFNYIHIPCYDINKGKLFFAIPS